nr:protein NUCLEAR FUSION DEFECTIVE 4 [Ipomoea batatas]
MTNSGSFVQSNETSFFSCNNASKSIKVQRAYYLHFHHPTTSISPESSDPFMAALQWLRLVAAIWLQSVSGTNTNFPVYSSDPASLKQLLSIFQVQLNNLAFANDAGKVIRLVFGIAGKPAE